MGRVVVALAMSLPYVVPGSLRAEDERAVPGHVDQRDIEEGLWTVPQLREAGRRLFVARFTRDDGAGRPRATGSREPRQRGTDAGFVRTSGPDANACVSCHGTPFVGGAGDFVANVFVGLGASNQSQESVAASFSNERGTPELHGTGVVELVAREITAALHATRDRAVEEARRSGEPVRASLSAKGIDYGAVTALPSGELVLDEVDGIDHDLVIRPFGQKGTIVSLREFTVNASNLHHGMQATERFGKQQTGVEDFDGDGIVGELSLGDITALTLFQATLSVPGRRLPADPTERRAVELGEQLFARIGCADCHVPELPIDNPRLLEPGPYNARGTLSSSDVAPMTIDLSEAGPGPHLERNDAGQFVARIYTDFKRHPIADDERPHWGNETVHERRLPRNVFLTRRLWAVGNTDPYGHRGDVTTLAEAIHHHGGRARDARLRFEGLPPEDRRAVVAFLKSMQILPDGSPPVVVSPPLERLPYATNEPAAD